MSYDILILPPIKISVSKNNHVWGVNSGDYIYRRTGNRWQQVSGRLKVVSVGLSGVWGVNSNDDIFYRTATYGDPDSQGTGVSKKINFLIDFNSLIV